MIRAHFTDNETGWVEPVGDRTAIVLGVPWTTDRFGYKDRVALVPSVGCTCKNCRIPQVADVVERSGMNRYVITLVRRKQKNIRRVVDAIRLLDPLSRHSALQESWEIRVATRLQRQTLAAFLRVALPFRVNVLDFYPGKVG